LGVLDTSRRQAQLANARSRLAQVESDLTLAGKRRERTASLLARGLTSQQSLDEVQLGEESLRAARDAARATVTDAELQISQSTLRAPYDAIVAERIVQPGAVVAAGAPVLRLVAATAREAHIGLPSQAAGTLVPGQMYALRVGQQRFNAPLRSLGDDLDPATLTLTAVFTLPATITASVGEPALLEISERVPSAGGWLPLTALIEGQRGLWTVLAVVESEAGSVTRRESVEVVHVEADRAYVRGTLSPGARVVATGLQRISPGAVIDPQPLIQPRVSGGTL
jgi:RND family efflux transporter MFP subunit